MRNRIHELTWAFADISEQITDIKTVLKLYEERLRESAEEPCTQSVLRGQLKQLELVERDCEQFEERLEELLRESLHGNL